MQPNKFQDITSPSEDTVQLFIYVSPGLNGFFTYFETYYLRETHLWCM